MEASAGTVQRKAALSSKLVASARKQKEIRKSIKILDMERMKLMEELIKEIQILDDLSGGGSEDDGDMDLSINMVNQKRKEKHAAQRQLIECDSDDDVFVIKGKGKRK